MRPYWISAAFVRSPAWRACSSSSLACFELLLGRTHLLDLFFFRLPLAFIADDFSLRSAIALFDVVEPGFGFFVGFAGQGLTFDLELKIFAFENVDLLRQRIDLDADRGAASSIRSMALSGKNRSVMYRFESVAAATIAASLMRTPW